MARRVTFANAGAGRDCPSASGRIGRKRLLWAGRFIGEVRWEQAVETGASRPSEVRGLTKQMSPTWRRRWLLLFLRCAIGLRRAPVLRSLHMRMTATSLTRVLARKERSMGKLL